jgi:histidinol-phosphate/aromatic aminotransferase/cobyric acid decarboxylase-like protein
MDYSRAAALVGLDVESYALAEEDGFALDVEQLEARLAPQTLVFLGQPSNPVGCTTPPEELRAMAARHPESTFVIDEAFAGFIEDFDTLANNRPANVIVLSSLTKLYAIPGLRLGLAFAAPEVATKIRAKLPPWSVNTLAQAAGVAALESSCDYVAQTRVLTRRLREDLARSLSDLPGFHVFTGTANYLLVRIDNGRANGPDANRLADLLLKEHGIAIRVCGEYEGLGTRFFRVAVRSADDNEKLVDALLRVLKSHFS